MRRLDRGLSQKVIKLDVDISRLWERDISQKKLDTSEQSPTVRPARGTRNHHQANGNICKYGPIDTLATATTHQQRC